MEQDENILAHPLPSIALFWDFQFHSLVMQLQDLMVIPKYGTLVICNAD